MARPLSTALIAGLVCAACARPPIPRTKMTEKLCGPEIPGADELLAPGSFALLGETHGTNEIPYVVGELACFSSTAGQPVTVAIEVGDGEQRFVDRFLQSAGTPEDQKRLLEGAFWNRPYQDGRSSKAVAAMLEQLRRFKAQGMKIRVVAYDVAGIEGNAHSMAMADRLLEDRRLHPEDTYLVLCGNVHARTVVGTQWDREFVPMGVWLRKSEKKLLALDADYAQGQAWTCKLAQPIQCGVESIPAPRRAHALPPAHAPSTHVMVDTLGNVIPTAEVVWDSSGGFRGYRPFVRLSKTPSAEGFDGIFYVGPITPSPPAATASLGPE